MSDSSYLSIFLSPNSSKRAQYSKRNGRKLRFFIFSEFIQNPYDDKPFHTEKCQWRSSSTEEVTAAVAVERERELARVLGFDTKKKKKKQKKRKKNGEVDEIKEREEAEGD